MRIWIVHVHSKESSTRYVSDLCIHYLTRKTRMKERTQNCSSFPFYFLVLHRTKKDYLLIYLVIIHLVITTVTFDSLYFNPMCVSIYGQHCCWCSLFFARLAQRRHQVFEHRPATCANHLRGA